MGFTSYGQLLSNSKDNEGRFLRKSKKQNKKAAVYIGIGSLALAAGIPCILHLQTLMMRLCVATGILLFRISAVQKKRVISLAVRKQAINIQLKPNNYLPTQTAIVLELNQAK